MTSSTLSAGAGVATPEWVQDAIFYQIFPDRFARSAAAPAAELEPWDSPPTVHGFKGGDLDGIVERLDYLDDLGVNALYLNPVFRSTANHRYHTHDYYQVDRLLGGNPALRRLLDAAHHRGMRVILDGVFNHASRGFFQFSSILDNGDASPYRDWFHVYSWPPNPYGAGDPGYDAWWGLPALPKFNTSFPAVRNFLWDVGAYWIEQGADGWRLDVPNEIDDDEFWREFRRRVKSVNPDAYIVGEIWDDGRRWLQGDQFDAVMNYLFTRFCLGFFAGGGLNRDALEASGLSGVVPLNAPAFAAAIDGLLDLYPPAITHCQLNLLGSHDTPRVLTAACGDESAVRLAVLFQMTYPGAPCIYYGDEVGLVGGPDPDCRGTFPWSAERWASDLHSYVKQCVTLRHTHAVLRRGDYQTLHADGNLYAFQRALDGTRAIVALNASAENAPFLSPPGQWRPIFGAGSSLSPSAFSIPPRSGIVLMEESCSS